MSNDTQNPTIDTGGGALIQGSVHTGGDFVGRDKIINQNIQNITERALTAAEEAKTAQDIARQQLAESLTTYVERMGKIAADEKDALQGGPYRGLQAYTLREAEIFFGRDETISGLLTHLQAGRLTILHAESGAGKSSLLQAGIQYQLIIQGHVPLYIRPYNKVPTLAIKQALLPSLDKFPELATASLRDYLHQVTTILGTQRILVILIDQFEELFFNMNEAQRQAFVDELARCLEDESLTVRWVLSLRAEFFSNVANFHPRIKNPFENNFRLNRLPADKARIVIEEPARLVGIDYESALIDTLLEDLRDPDSGEVAPAQLQLVCLALYNLLPAQAKRITLAMYEQEGRTAGILQGYLQRVLRQEVGKADRELARQLLIALVSSDQRRIRRSKSELAATLFTYLTAAQSLDGLLNQLVDSRLLNSDEAEHTDELSYELAHDLLVHQIELDPETQARKAAEELLKQEAETFKRFGTLLDAKKFDIINSQREFLVLNADATELLRQSQDAIEAEEQEREAARQRELEQQRALAEEQRKRAEEQEQASARLRRRAMIATGVGIVAVMAAIVAGIFFFRAEESAQEALNAQATAQAESTRAISNANAAATAQAQAEQNAQLAEQQARINRASALAAQAVLRLEENPEESIIIAMEAVTTTYDVDGTVLPAAEQALHQAVHTSQARYTTHGHTADVLDMALHPNGNLLATGGWDNVTRLWHFSNGILQPHPHPLTNTNDVFAVAFNPNSPQLAVANAEGFVQLWNIADDPPSLQDELPLNSNIILDIAFSPDGQQLVTASFDGSAALLDVTTGISETLFEPGVFLCSAAFSSDGQHVAIGGANGTITLIQLSTGEQVEYIHNESASNVCGVAFSPADNSLMLTGGDNGRARLWQLGNNQPLLEFDGHTNTVTQVAFTPDGERILTISFDRSIKLWDAMSGRLLWTFSGHQGFVNAMSLSNNGQYLITTGADETIKVWSMAGYHQERGSRVRFADDGSRVVTTGRDGTTRVWQPPSGQQVARYDDNSGNTYDAAFYPNNTYLAIVNDDGMVRVRDTTTDELRFEVLLTEQPLFAVAINYDGTLLAAAGPQTVFILDAHTGKQLRSTSIHSNDVYALAFHPTRNLLASGGQAGEINVMDATTLQLIDEQTILQTVEYLSFSHTGQYLAAASGNERIFVWDVNTNQEAFRISGHDDLVSGVAFTSNDKYLVTSSLDQTVKVWDISDVPPESTLSNPRLILPQPNAINSMALSLDDSLLVTLSSDGRVQFLPFLLNIEDMLTFAKTRVTINPNQ